ncbi:beta-ketoacyl-ACP synthase III [Paenibacillus sp. J2TS4]|uniref:beta-ketoacyl-ACP synthase III n=1 Tax=Paenibacillus sp. J2TS4 TaxID=2807194 RepID=UPI001B0B941A|nr:beta-ketoacyl-ACP synthase III [Paenibacillus sp. J2TS4]GIP35767.1 3-oxoacyl-ACP synthase [Paenibacillus sp. J2TS4]
MQARNVVILGTGKYLPVRRVQSDEMDRRLGTSEGWTLRKTDVHVRHFAVGETASEMGAAAAYEALKDAGLRLSDIDCLVCASGTAEQPIPCTAALIQKAMGGETSGIPCFDVNSTCLSFLTGLDVLSYLIDAGRYERVLLVSTEVASIGLNWRHKESGALFGDGAAAVVIGRSAAGAVSKIVCSSMETYSQGAHLSEIRGGGTRIHPREHTADREEDFLFHMNGRGIFKMAAKLLPPFVDKLLLSAGLTMRDIHVVVPHQGSAMAMRLITEKLGISREQLVYITPNHGNTIAASIPMGLHEAAKQGRVNRGDRVLLLGTSAGLSLGGMVLVY